MLVPVAVVTLLLAQQAGHTQLEAQQRLGRSLIQFLEPALRRGAAGRDAAGLEQAVRRLAADPAVAVIRITDNTGAPLLEHRGDLQPTGLATRWLVGDPERSHTTDILAGGRKIGQAQIVLSARPLNENVARVIANGVMAAAGLLFITLLLSYLLHALPAAQDRSGASAHRDEAANDEAPVVPPRRAAPAGAEAEGAPPVTAPTPEIAPPAQPDPARLQTLLQTMQEVVFELDAEGRIQYLNPAWPALTGFAVEESLGRHLSHYLATEESAGELAPEALPRLPGKKLDVCLRTSDGKCRWVRLRVEARRDAQERFTGILGTLGDITRSVELDHLLRRYQDEIYQLSVTDPLTGLYNRRHFDGQLEAILAEHLPKNLPVCLLLIDLDGFKFINDTYGHHVGDEVLRTTALMLQRQVRRNDYIARMAGDEFAMVLKNTDIKNATHIARKLHGQISGAHIPLPMGHMQLQLRIGVAEAPTHGRNARDLVSAADVALYHSKRRGGNRIEVLSPDVSQATMSIFSQGFRLRGALEQGQIHPAFQPIYDMQTGTLVAYEVLARLRLDDGVVQAKDFIALAAELGLTRDIDLHIIREALRFTPKRQALFLNVDPASFTDKEFVRELTEQLRAARADDRPITIEVTERASPAIEDLKRELDTLRALGCKIALDDFGSGYTTYNFLSQLRPDYLKIEGSFVRAMLTNEADRKIVAHIHGLAQSFGMKTIAESVENEATEKALQQIGIHKVQGWLYGAPQFSA